MDCVTLGPGLVIEKQLIGVADNATDMDGMDGILGALFWPFFPLIAGDSSTS